MIEKSYAHIPILSQPLNKLIFCLMVVSFFFNNIHAQQFNNWYFPLQNGITFNTNPPSFLAGSQLGTTFGFGQFSCASISDNNGNLLFSTDGIVVWDKNNNRMPNGFGLLGRNAKLNGALIVPFINESNKYYLFTGEGYFGTASSPDTLKYCYSVIDMNANNGLGDVTTKNAFIRNFSAEKMVAIPHANGTDIWFICRDWTNNFYSYKITCKGIDTSNIVVNTVGSNLNNNVNFIFGDIKASNDGKFIAACYRDYFELYKFDNSTGKLSDPIFITDLNNTRTFYGIEFSPNNKLLYITQRFDNPSFDIGSQITQYSISNYDSALIINSRIIVSQQRFPLGLNSEAGLQLGPDNKIYFATSLPKIGRIEFPDIAGIACSVKDSIILLPNVTRRRLPYSYVNLITSQNVQINYTVANDCRTVTLTGKTFIKGNNLLFKWKFGDGDSLLQLVTSQGDTTFNTVTHFYPPGVDTFFASLTVTSDTVCGQGSAGKPIVVKPPKPKANFGVATQCNSLAVQFTDSSLLNFNPSISYNWQFGNGQTSNLANNGAIVFPTYGNYTASLIVTSSFSCVESDTLVKNFSLFQNPTATFTIANANCINNPVLLNSTTAINNKDSIATYFWQNGTSVSATNNNTSSFNFTSGGNKTVQHWVITQNGCKSDTATQTFLIETTPQVNFSNTKACVNEPIFFTNNSSNTFGNITQLTWSLGNNTTAFGNVVSNTYANFGNYTIQLKASTAKGCVDSIRKTITISPIVANAGNDTAVFANQPFLLNGSGGNNYNWQPAFLVNNNQTANPIVRLQQSQTFILTVSNNEQCTDTDSVFVKVLKPIEIPNAFSPNGDGINDVWVIKNLSDYSNAQLQIFNRYGQMVFSSTNYQNNFNGTLNGKPLPIATYYYVLTVKGNGFSLPVFKGGVTLLK